ncbi:MAG: hypothetical protein FJ222_00835 [Lentisphaerae bacterium]|nr:hypothetical protein [Lentisphaerota bacterium]
MKKLSSTRQLERSSGLLLAFGALALATAPAVGQAGFADARFQGTGKADPIRISSVISKPTGEKGSGMIAFDIAWDHSWRAVWDEPDARLGGKGPAKFENWDAAWVFVKFHKPGADGWSHATLSTNAAHHGVPAGARLDVGTTDDGQRGLGVFVYRDAPGSGPNNWKGVTLRWLHGADGVTSLDKVTVAAAGKARPQEVKGGRGPSFGGGVTAGDPDLEKALNVALAGTATKQSASDGIEIALFAIPMVYVPEGAFWVGDGVVATNDESQLVAELDAPEDDEMSASEPAPKADPSAKKKEPPAKENLSASGYPKKQLPIVAAQLSAGNGTEPFRIESEAALTLGGANPKYLGNRDGIRGADDFSSILGRQLPSGFPKGFAAFYCMRYEISQGEFTAFLNTLSSKQQAAVMGAMGSGHHGIKVAVAGTPALYDTDAPYLACDGFSYLDGARYAAWAGLRPMTELEYEKACRGPLKPVPGEYAWGTDKLAGSNAPLPPQDGYAVVDPYTPNERVVWEGANGPDAERGNAAWAGTTMRSVHNGKEVSHAINEINRPLRCGIFATPDSDRVRAGASYWGIMELTGNLFEPTVTIGNPLGRQFPGTHGDGIPITHSAWRLRETSFLLRGCGVFGWWSPPTCLRVSDRGSLKDKSFMGFRCVRTARPSTPAESRDEFKRLVQTLFHQALRIDNVAVERGDAKTTTVRFDITWDESWRNATNHDAAWVFFKARSEGATNWHHVRLAADQVLNPAGYGQETGTKLEFVVPDGPDGFTGVFLRRTAPGTGPLSAKGVTVVCDAQAPNTAIQPFGIEMVYVAEGSFYLGSGGTEPNRFYQYTDGSQNTRPYQVMDSGAIPTGPQEGRLWALGVTPDATDAGEIPAAFPTGYEAFYCMKFPLKQGQFAGFLEMQSEVQSDAHAFHGGDWPVCLKYSPSKGVGLTWWQGAAFGAWAGLRPMSELEYEKACRGPGQPNPDEVGPGYWGIRLLNLGGPFQQTVSVGDAIGRRFAGTHGRGVTKAPADWPPPEGNGIMLRGACFGNQASQARTSYRSKTSTSRAILDQAVSLPSNDFEGWRGARTAPALAPTAAKKEKEPLSNSQLELDPLPDLRNADIIVFYLAGQFRNAESKALKVELASPLPDACFPEGPASRAFTAAPDSSTSFRILTVLTRQTARSIRKVQMVSCRIQTPDGNVLAEQRVRLPLPDPLLTPAPPVVGVITGGAVPLLITNATDRAHPATIEIQPPQGMVMSETNRRIDIPPGGLASTTLTVPGQAVSPGVYSIRYQVTVGSGAPQAGDTAAELRAQSRWWVGRRQLPKKGPSMDVNDESQTPGGGDDLDALLGNSGMKKPEKKSASDDPAWAAAPADVFQSGKLPERWEQVINGASLWLGKLNPLPDANTIVLAATRITAPADRDAVIQVGSETVGWTWLDNKVLASKDFGMPPGSKPFVGRVWVNGDVVYDTHLEAQERRKSSDFVQGKTFRLRKGGNTMLVQCRANGDKPENLANVFVLFRDAKDGKLMDDLVLDVTKPE